MKQLFQKEQLKQQQQAPLVQTDQEEETTPLPVYYINLDASTDRRSQVESQLPHAVRVSAVPSQDAMTLIKKGDVILKEPMKAISKGQRNVKTGEFLLTEVACALSHLKAIAMAYDSGDDIALIMEDDMTLSNSIIQNWRTYIANAPTDWTMLQLFTSNNFLRQQASHLDADDYWVAWTPLHYGACAYMLNREGMRRILDNTRIQSSSPTATIADRSTKWRFDKYGLVVADEVLYYYAKQVYSSTYPLVDLDLNFTSTISNNEYRKKRQIFPVKKDLGSFKVKKHNSNVLILMSIRIKSLDEVKFEAGRIKADAAWLSMYHDESYWNVKITVVSDELLKPTKRILLDICCNVHFVFDVNHLPFNKFLFIQENIPLMPKYDMVLIKDNDQRIAGLPWSTFLQHKQESVIMGPLRQTIEEGLLVSSPQRQWFRLHQATNWYKHEWLREQVASLASVRVPLLEMYLVLMDSDFAQWCFPQVLTSNFLNGPNCWGIDEMWCGAALEYNANKASCSFLPVVSVHDDTRQVPKSDLFSKQGWANKKYWNTTLPFATWFKTSQRWEDIAHNYIGIKNYCSMVDGGNSTNLAWTCDKA